MFRKTAAFVLFVALSIITNAQGTLQFSQALIVSDNQLTVPSNKVWKVTSIYGAEFTANQCINATNTYDWLGIKCNSNFSNPSYVNNQSVTLSYFSTQMIINGVRVVNELSGLPTSGVSIKFSTNCTNYDNYTNQSFSCANKSVNPNLLPMWLPAGTTLATGGPNTFVSVLEFNIIP